MVRVGPVHYNPEEKNRRFGEFLRKIAEVGLFAINQWI